MAESQDAFSYIAPVDHRLSLQISAPRLAPYLNLAQVAGDFDSAIKWYLWNARLAKAFLFPLQTAEVSVRNTIHSAFSQNFNNVNWIFNPPFPLTPEHTASLSQTRQRLMRRNSNPTADDIVASLSFDFWSNLFRIEYDALWLTPNLIATAFPHAPSGADRERIQKNVRRINKLRNRIAHHEPIHNISPSAQIQLQIIEELVGYICLDTARWMKNHTTVLQVTRSQPTTGSQFSGFPLSSANIRPPVFFAGDEPLVDAIKQMRKNKPSIALIPNQVGGSQYLMLSLDDIANYIVDIAGQQQEIIDLSEYKVSDLIGSIGNKILEEITVDATTGDVSAMFFPKGKGRLKPDAIIVKDLFGNIQGVIIKPTIRL